MAAQHLEAKVVIIGDTDVGKTSLSSYYCHGEIPASPTPTIGARCEHTARIQLATAAADMSTLCRFCSLRYYNPQLAPRNSQLATHAFPCWQLFDEAAGRQGEREGAAVTSGTTNLGHGWPGALPIDGGSLVPTTVTNIHKRSSKIHYQLTRSGITIPNARYMIHDTRYTILTLSVC